MQQRTSRDKINFSVIILMIFSIGLQPIFSQEIFAQEQTLPEWTRTIAVWWGEDKISDEDFINTFQYLVKNKILEIPPAVNDEFECGPGLVLNATNDCVIHDESDTDGIFLSAFAEQQKTVLSLIKTTTLWWGEGKIANEDFIVALQYLVENNVLTVEPEKQPLVQPELKPLPEDLIIWPKIDKIEDFIVQGHGNLESYYLQFKLVDAQKKPLTPDGTLSIVFMDDRQRILYLDAFSIRKAHYQDSFSAFDETDEEGEKVYSWEIETEDVSSGFTPYGKVKLVFTDKYGLKFFSEVDGVSIPQFN